MQRPTKPRTPVAGSCEARTRACPSTRRAVMCPLESVRPRPASPVPVQPLTLWPHAHLPLGQDWRSARCPGRRPDDLLGNLNESVYEGHIELHPRAFLHKFREEGPLHCAQYAPWIEPAPLFIEGQGKRLRAFIKQWVRRGDRRQVIFRVDRAGSVCRRPCPTAWAPSWRATPSSR